MDPGVLERLENIAMYAGTTGMPSLGSDLMQLITAFRRTREATVAADGGPRHSDPTLVIQAVRNAGLNGDTRAARWVYVMLALGIGSTFARELCHRAELDPDEIIGTDPNLSGDEEQDNE